MKAILTVFGLLTSAMLAAPDAESPFKTADSVEWWTPTYKVTHSYFCVKMDDKESEKFKGLLAGSKQATGIGIYGIDDQSPEEGFLVFKSKGVIVKAYLVPGHVNNHKAMIPCTFKQSERGKYLVHFESLTEGVEVQQEFRDVLRGSLRAEAESKGQVNTIVDDISAKK